MKKFLVILIIAAFISIAVFGFFSVGNPEHGFAKCVASLAASLPCPSNGGLGHFIFHFNIIKSFSLAPLAPLFLISIILLAIFLSFGIGGALSSSWRQSNYFLFSNRNQARGFIQAIVLRWLTLLEKRDSSSTVYGRALIVKS